MVQYANNWHGLLVSGTCLDILGICLLPVVWSTLKIQEDSKGALRKLCYGGKHNRGALGSFKFQTSANLLFSLPQIINPTVNILNHRPIDLEGAKAALSNPLFRAQPCLSVLVNLPDIWPVATDASPHSSSEAMSNHSGSHPRPTFRARSQDSLQESSHSFLSQRKCGPNVHRVWLLSL